MGYLFSFEQADSLLETAEDISAGRPPRVEITGRNAIRPKKVVPKGGLEPPQAYAH